MALRLGDAELLARGSRLHRNSFGSRTAPVHEAKCRWIDGIAAGDRVAVEAAAATFEELGLLIHAADAWADAAILAARAGLDSDAEHQALVLCESTGMHPLLGPLPERRWLGSSSTQEREPDVTPA